MVSERNEYCSTVFSDRHCVPSVKSAISGNACAFLTFTPMYTAWFVAYCSVSVIVISPDVF